MFTWEGFDYIGEPTPYPWPARSSQYGLVDLAGLPKDCYYLYQTQWLDKPIVHLFPHWNWHKGMDIPVWVYTNCEKVELFLNGKSLGERSLLDEDYNDVLHLEWIVPFEPGELKAVAKNKGDIVATKSVITASEPHHIILTPEHSVIDKDGDLAYIRVSVHDINGNICPTANNLITFKVKGPGKVIGTDNGNPISLEPFDAQQRHVFGGLAIAVVKSLGQAGDITLIAASAGLNTAVVTIKTK
jgi:beta-galactosidase